MFGTPFRILMLLWTIVWFVLVLPGHTRGIVQLGGSDTTSATSFASPMMQATGCTACVFPPAGASEDDDEPQPAPGGHCAVCKHMASLETPPPIIQLNLVSEILRAAELRSTACSSRIAERVYVGRAPPALT
jgi:hypothetical protein